MKFGTHCAKIIFFAVCIKKLFIFLPKHFLYIYILCISLYIKLYFLELSKIFSLISLDGCHLPMVFCFERIQGLSEYSLPCRIFLLLFSLEKIGSQFCEFCEFCESNQFCQCRWRAVEVLMEC